MFPNWQQPQQDEEEYILPPHAMEMREAREAEAQRQQQQAEAAANQPAPQPEDEKAAILLKHVQAAQKELTERAQLTATQRTLETAQAKQTDLANEYDFLAREYSKNAPRLAEIEAQLKQVAGEIKQTESALAFQRAQQAESGEDERRAARLASQDSRMRAAVGAVAAFVPRQRKS